MTFVNLSAFTVIAGLLVIATFLILTHFLRMHHPDKSVVTTMFWQRAFEEISARRLWHRFRQLASYLLALLICALIWISLGEPEINHGDSHQRYVLLIDASAGMSIGDRYGRAVKKLYEDVRRIPRNQRQVYWLGARVKNVLAPGEDMQLLGRRLQGLVPQAAPSLLERQLRHLASVSPVDQTTTVLVYGDAPFRQAVLEALPATLKVVRATESVEVTNNSGITALGIAEAESGAWDRFDIFLRIVSDADREIGPDEISVTLDGKTIDVNFESLGRDGEYIFRDIVAGGGVLTVKLGEDQLSLDNVARVRLPRRPIIRVELSPSLQAPLADLLHLDPALIVVENDADVLIRRSGEKPESRNIPTLEFAPVDAQDNVLVLTSPNQDSASTVQWDRLSSMIIDHVKVDELAEVAPRSAGVSIKSGERRTISIWDEILGEKINVTGSRIFPLIIARSLRWLVQSESWYAYAAAGKPLVSGNGDVQHAVLSPNGKTLVTLGVPLVPEQVGDWPDKSSDGLLAVSLLDLQTTLGRPPFDEAAQLMPANLEHVTPLLSNTLVTGLLLSVLLLVALEWLLYQQGWLP